MELSPCVLVPKSDGTYHFCTDFRKVNSVTMTDSYPIPQIDDCINRIGHSKYVSKFYLLKVYWQVPLISAFVTTDVLFQYCAMSFGMKNAQAKVSKLKVKNDCSIKVYSLTIMIVPASRGCSIRVCHKVSFVLRSGA